MFSAFSNFSILAKFKSNAKNLGVDPFPGPDDHFWAP